MYSINNNKFLKELGLVAFMGTGVYDDFKAGNEHFSIEIKGS